MPREWLKVQFAERFPGIPGPWALKRVPEPDLVYWGRLLGIQVDVDNKWAGQDADTIWIDDEDEEED
jgi:hypothetical protein